MRGREGGVEGKESKSMRRKEEIGRMETDINETLFCCVYILVFFLSENNFYRGDFNWKVLSFFWKEQD